LALALVLSAGSEARAEIITWQYAWTANPTTLPATVGSGQVAFNAQSGSQSSTAGTPVGILGTAVQFTSSATQGSPDMFTNVPVSLTANVTDGTSGLSDAVVFSGQLNGNLWNGGNSLTLSLPNPTQSLTLGGHQYSVSAVPVLTEFLAGNGAVFALVTASDVQKTPEPSTLLLAVLGLPIAGAAARNRRCRSVPAAG
jgi:hypothetical protein